MHKVKLQVDDGIGVLLYLSREQLKTGTQSFPVWSCKGCIKPAHYIFRPNTKAWKTYVLFSGNKCCTLGTMPLFFQHITISRKPPAAFQLHSGNHYPSALRQSPISNYTPCRSCTASVLAVFWCASFFYEALYNALSPLRSKVVPLLSLNLCAFKITRMNLNKLFVNISYESLRAI